MKSLLLLAALASLLLAPSLRSATPGGIDTAGMDPSLVPGDDFYGYANGTWLAVTEIPSDRGSWGTGAVLFQATSERLRDLIESKVRGRAGVDANEALVADYHTAFMNEAAIEAHGLEPLQPLLHDIATVQDKTALARLLGHSLRADVDPLNATNFFTENLFGLWVAQAFDDPAHYTPYLLQGGLGMPDRAYYLTESERMEKLRETYRAHIATLLSLAGVPDAAARAGRVFALELQLARAHATREESGSVLQANNPWRREDFAAKAPGLDWSAFFAAAGLDTQPRIIVWHPGAVTGAAALVAKEPLETWRDYLTFHTVNQFASVLPKAFADARFAFYDTAVAGTPQQAARWKRALASANGAIGNAVGQVYVAKYFPPASKTKVQAMVASLVQAFDVRIGRLDWMAPTTKAQARAKLHSLYIGVGYPDRWEDYRGLVIDPTDAAGNLLRAQAFHYRARVARLGGLVDRTEWAMDPQVVDAVNLPMQNAMNFPAAFLQPPFFDPAAPDAVNYATLGAVIGHEISHSFDDQGAQFDATGRLRDWWTPDDLAHFQASAAALVAQYNAYRPFPDLGVNGQLTLSENLADLAGLAAAYDAFRALPVAPESTPGARFTPDQTFFLAFAQSWRVKMREGVYRQRLIGDGHAPAKYRALTVRNLDAWHAAFAVPCGQALYLEPSTRVRVW
jgi:putative endopeptidase